MKTLYLDCGMGAAGDMLASALFELLPDPDALLAELNALGIPGVRYARESACRCGITGTRLRVSVFGREEACDCPDGQAHIHDHEHDHGHDHGHDHDHDHGHEDHHEHSHTGLKEVESLVAGMAVGARVKENILSVYRAIAAAEGRVHGLPADRVHFHEVGSLDAVADITAVCLLIEKIAPDEVIASPVRTGYGQIRCAHGILPVPAPATAELLRGIPIYGGEFAGEMCTPTGAALLSHFVTRFGEMPIMATEAIGYGMGTREFPAANCVRAFLGETDGQGDCVTELCCNLDDMTGEEIGFATEALMNAGALDVYTVPVGMKKGRPGILLTVLCRQAAREETARLIFRYTDTLGIRERLCRRYRLDRREEIRHTPAGEVSVKISEGYGIRREKTGYEDAARLARERGISLREARKLLDSGAGADPGKK